MAIMKKWVAHMDHLGTARYKMAAILVVMAVMLTGCGGTYKGIVIVEGQRTKPVAFSSWQEIKAKMAQDGAVSIKEFAALRAGNLAGAGNAATLRVEASSVNIERIDPAVYSIDVALVRQFARTLIWEAAIGYRAITET